MMKETKMTIRDDMEKLTDVLRGDVGSAVGSAYALGWIQSMVAELEHDADLKLNKRQKVALKTLIAKNINWAQSCASKRSR